MVSQPTQRLHQERCGLLDEVLIPWVVARYVVPARSRAVGSLHEKAEVRFKDGGEESDERKIDNTPDRPLAGLIGFL